VILPATASTGITVALAGSPRHATVLAAFDRAVYLAHDDGVLALETHDGAHLPNGLVVAAPSSRRPLAGAGSVTTATVGAGEVVLGDLTVRTVRWRRARPVLPTVGVRELATSLAAAADTLATLAPTLPPDLARPFDAVVAGLAAGDGARAWAAARRGLLGRGPGLTPSGDDLLAGLVAGTGLLAEARGCSELDEVAATARRIGADLAAVAPDATTAISAGLLRHAARGEVAAPAAVLLRALTGHGPIEAAVRSLLGFGSSSGRDLTVGLLAAAELVLVPAGLLGRAR
jgi:hypothetical protein